MIKLPFGFLLVALLVLVSGCKPQADALSATSTPMALITEEHPINPGDTSPTSISEPVPITTQEMIPTVTPVRNLGLGPWLMYYPEPFISNIDGSALTQLDLPGRVDDFPWWLFEIIPSPDGGYLAVKISPNNTEYELVIMQLPNLEIVNTVSLLGEQAQQAVDEYFRSDEAFYLRAPVQASIEMSAFLWSPNGRYLAFVSASDDPNSNVFIFDREQNSFQRLTQYSDQAILYGWSPDSQWIISASATRINDYGFASLSDVWAVSINGEIRKLYTPEGGGERILGWTSDHSFIIQSITFESSYWGLKEVDILSGNIRSLYGFTYANAVFTGNMFFLTCGGPLDSCSQASPGLYRLSFGDTDLQPIVQGSMYGLQWYPSIQLISVVKSVDNGTITQTFDTNGKEKLSFPGRSSLYPSPDGKWILVRSDETNMLVMYDGNGNLAAEIGEAHDLVWLDDSTAFVSFNAVTQEITVYKVENHWLGDRPIKINLPTELRIHRIEIIYP